MCQPTEYIRNKLSDNKEDIYEVITYTDENGNKKENTIPYLYNALIGCDHNIVGKLSGGVICTKCNAWCCF